MEFNFDYRDTYEYRTHIETLTPYQKYLFDNDRTEYVKNPRVYFKKIYTEDEAEYLASYGVYHTVLNHIQNNFCVEYFSKNPIDFRFVKDEFKYLENLYGPTYKPDLSQLVRDEEIVNKAKIFWNVKIAMNNGNWELLKTILESNLNVVDEHFTCLYYENFWYILEIEDITPLDIAIRLGFDINNNSKKIIYTGGTLLNWILISCSDSYRYDINLTKSEDFILELIRYCFESGATHPKYNLFNYNTIILPDKIKDLFNYYENQIEDQFDFTKYDLLKKRDKETLKNILLSIEKKRFEGGIKPYIKPYIKPCIIRDTLNLFSVQNFIFSDPIQKKGFEDRSNF